MEVYKKLAPCEQRGSDTTLPQLSNPIRIQSAKLRLWHAEKSAEKTTICCRRDCERFLSRSAEEDDKPGKCTFGAFHPRLNKPHPNEHEPFECFGWIGAWTVTMYPPVETKAARSSMSYSKGRA